MLDNPAKVFYHFGLGKMLAAFSHGSVYYKGILQGGDASPCWSRSVRDAAAVTTFPEGVGAGNNLYCLVL